MREEWAVLGEMFDPSEIGEDDCIGAQVAEHIRKRPAGRTVYRRTVTTTAWVEVPGKDE